MHASDAGLKEAFDGAEAECKPLVMRGLASEWPACSKWGGDGGLRHLEAKAGQEEVQVRYSHFLLLSKDEAAVEWRVVP